MTERGPEKSPHTAPLRASRIYNKVSAGSAQPLFRIQLGCFLAQLELQDAAPADSTDGLARADFLSLSDTDRTEIGIDRDIDTVADHHDTHAARHEDTAHLAHEDAADSTARRTFDVDAVVVQPDVRHTGDVILAEMADDASRQRHRQPAAVVGETAGYGSVGRAEHIIAF